MARINSEQVKKVADFLKHLPHNGHGMNFYDFDVNGKRIIAEDMYPELHHPQAINFFFFVCLHQHGFWHGNNFGYMEPLVGSIGGKTYKGSDLLWRMAKKALDKHPLAFCPEMLAEIGPEGLFKEIFVDDSGPVPFPDLEKRLAITRMYGNYFVKNKTNPSNIVSEANSQKEPLKYFLDRTKKISGFHWDILRKKNLLLAMIMANRPEKFLSVKDSQSWLPIVDYHLMRIALRLGLVDLIFYESEVNALRRWVNYLDEKRIRLAVYDAVKQLIRDSGRAMPFVDEMMWNARKYCPEMTKPDCSKCVFSEVCKKRTELFQPVFRTTDY